MDKVDTCSFPGCERPVAVKKHGLCGSHYHKMRSHGSPGGGRTQKGQGMAFLRNVAAVHQGDECLIFPYGRTTGGYGLVQEAGVKHGAHRFVCELVNGKPPTQSHHAIHSCGKGHLGCVNPRHIRWGTRFENMADRISHGTANRGEKHGMSKLTDEKVRKIRSLQGTQTQTQIGQMFGITPTAVGLIHRRLRWGHIPD